MGELKAGAVDPATPESRAHIEEQIVNLRRSIEITKDARFHANRRLSNRHKNSAYMISILSTGVILLSLIPNFWVLTQPQVQILLTSSIMLSVFIIFTSLLDSSSNFYYRAEVLHHCARKLHKVFYDSQDINPDSPDARNELAKLRQKYEDILADCSVNHDGIDYMRVRIGKPRLFSEHYSANPIAYYPQRGLDFIMYQFALVRWTIPHLIVGAIVTIVVSRFILHR